MSLILDYGYDRMKATMLTMKLTEKDLPINPLMLVSEKYDVDIIYDNLEGEEGYTFYDPKRNRYRICIDNKYVKGRCNFTIAHEVGHIILGHFHNYNLDEKKTHALLDKHANAFASALLMPEHILTKFDYSSSIHSTAKIFGVSIEALTIRVNYINAV